jgi:hypothetical protein
VPTPFKRLPYEFIVGFRKTYGLVLLAGFLLAKGVQVNNFNLAIGSLGLLFIVSLTYYSKPEPLQFVWLFKQNAAGFLRSKVWSGLGCLTLLTASFVLVLFACFPNQWKGIVLLLSIGYPFFISVVLAKYVAYPGTISLPQAILYARCFTFPPFLIILIVFFYNRAKRNLIPLLG